MKKGNKKNNKRVKTIVIYTSMLLGAINFAKYPASYSKYYASENVLRYETLLYQLKHDLTLEEIKISDNPRDVSTPSNVYLKFAFDRNNIGSDINRDSYSIQIPEVCNVERVTSKSTNISQDKKVITYTTEEKEDKIAVVIKCGIDETTSPDNGKSLNIGIRVNETITDVNSKNETFLYTSGKYSEAYLDYTISEDGTRLTIPSLVMEKLSNADKDRIYKEWLTKYDNNSTNLLSTLITYIEKNLNTITTDFNKNFHGFKTYMKNGSYVFEIDDPNFKGYAYTDDIKSKVRFYFSTKKPLEEKDSLMKAFDYYLKEYSIVKNNPEEIELIKNYILAITENVGIAQILNEKKDLPGLDYTEETNGIMRIEISYPDIMDYAYSAYNKKIRITYKDASMQGEMLAIFIQALPLAYPELINDEIKDYIAHNPIVSNGKVLQLVVTQTTEAIDLEFKLEKYGLIFKVTSDGQKYNYIEVVSTNANTVYDQISNGIKDLITEKDNVSNTVDNIEVGDSTCAPSTKDEVEGDSTTNKPNVSEKPIIPDKNETETTDKPNVSEKDETEETDKPNTSEKDETETTDKPNVSDKNETEETNKPNTSEKDETETTDKPNVSDKNETEETNKPSVSEKDDTEEISLVLTQENIKELQEAFEKYLRDDIYKNSKEDAEIVIYYINHILTENGIIDIINDKEYDSDVLEFSRTEYKFNFVPSRLLEEAKKAVEEEQRLLEKLESIENELKESSELK